MFFRTQLKTIGAGGAIDMQGRRLSFIGYLPAKAGDWVFTDGNVIFGNSPPKGSPTPATEQPSGIPVLSDDLRGYFTSRGKFKSYKIAGSDWIVNGEKNFAHDSDASNIIDAEIAYDGGIYTVEKIIEEIGGTPDNDTFKEIVVGGGTTFYSGDILENSDLCEDDGELSRKPIIIIKKDGKEILNIDIYRHLQGFGEVISQKLDDYESERGVLVVNDILSKHFGTRTQIANFKMLSKDFWYMLVSNQTIARRVYRHKRENVEWVAIETQIDLVQLGSDGSTLYPFRSVSFYSTPPGHSPAIVAGELKVSDRYYFPIQGNFLAEIKFAEATPAIWWSWALTKIYKGDEQIADFSDTLTTTDAHKWNMSLAELRGGQYLFGIHKDKEHEVGGALYKVGKGGNIEQVGTGLRNFRLRELKNISKARK